jgi:hypothetical protein
MIHLNADRRLSQWISLEFWRRCRRQEPPRFQLIQIEALHPDISCAPTPTTTLRGHCTRDFPQRAKLERGCLLNSHKPL